RRDKELPAIGEVIRAEAGSWPGYWTASPGRDGTGRRRPVGGPLASWRRFKRLIPTASTSLAEFDSTATPTRVSATNPTKLRYPPVPPLCHRGVPPGPTAPSCHPSRTRPRGGR